MKKIQSKRDFITQMISAIAALVLLMLLQSILSRNALIIGCFLVALLAVMVFVALKVLGKTEKILSWITPLLIAVVLPASILFYRAEDYTFVSGGLPFWAASAVMTIGIAVIAAVLLYPVFKMHSEEGDEIEDRKKSAVFGVAITVVVIAFLSFFLIESGIKHLNYLMDSEVPESITTKIVDKDYINRSK